MINFSRVDTKVQLSLEYKSGGVNKRILFHWECDSEILSESLSKQLEDMKDKTIEREIKTAYEAGYKAGRKKKQKRTWFHCFLTHINDSLPEWKTE